MTLAMKLATWLAFFPCLSLACSGGSGRPSRLSDGGYSLSCKGPLSDCLHHAEHLCKDQGYAVEEARDVRERLGGETGQSQVVIQKSDATIYCGESAPKEPIRLQREPEAAAPAPAKPPAAPRVCVPGATQACVGPAGCSGGQACSADGTRYGDCNCGSAAAAPSPAAAP
ncbi:MAG TPA: hypothetical protein VHB79_18990 [Polyangiaceae bacterium]|nr:hypothetical protein [Polyangiaceae bacterium]